MPSRKDKQTGSSREATNRPGAVEKLQIDRQQERSYKQTGSSGEATEKQTRSSREATDRPTAGEKLQKNRLGAVEKLQTDRQTNRRREATD